MRLQRTACEYCWVVGAAGACARACMRACVRVQACVQACVASCRSRMLLLTGLVYAEPRKPVPIFGLGREASKGRCCPDYALLPHLPHAAPSACSPPPWPSPTRTADSRHRRRYPSYSGVVVKHTPPTSSSASALLGLLLLLLLAAAAMDLPQHAAQWACLSRAELILMSGRDGKQPSCGHLMFAGTTSSGFKTHKTHDPSGWPPRGPLRRVHNDDALALQLDADAVGQRKVLGSACGRPGLQGRVYECVLSVLRARLASHGQVVKAPCVQRFAVPGHPNVPHSPQQAPTPIHHVKHALNKTPAATPARGTRPHSP